VTPPLPKLLLLATVAAGLVGWGDSSILAVAPVQGSVSGRVIVSVAPPPPPTPLSPYARRRYSPPQAAGQPGGAEDAFVYLESLDRQVPTDTSRAVVITQRQRTILPHTVVAQVGQVVEFPNEDDVYHNLFSLSSGNRFNLGRYAPGVTETNVFKNPGVVHLFCDIHAEMAGEILVVNTPYATRVGADGTYDLSVPAGRYRAVAWHPTAGADTATIMIPDGPAVAQDFALIGGR
jgi:plastocyanin